MYLFCYGTLKKGRNNHEYLDGSDFLGNFITSRDFSLVVAGLPFLVKRSSRSGVKGEVYKIDSETLREIDRLEGHPNFYYREVITVYNEENGEPLEVYSYIHPDIFNKNFDFNYRVCREF